MEPGSQTFQDMGMKYNLDLLVTDLDLEATNSPRSSSAEGPNSHTTWENSKPLSRFSPNPTRRGQGDGRIEVTVLNSEGNPVPHWVLAQRK